MSGAITATAVAVAAMSATEIFTAIAVVGAVTGAVGAITGSKELQIAGTVMGVVGGVGGLASSAGLFAGAGELFGVGTAASVAESAADTAGTISSVAQAADEGLSGAVQGISNIPEMTGSGMQGLPINAVEPGTTQTPLLGIGGDNPAAPTPVVPDPKAAVTPASGNTDGGAWANQTPPATPPATGTVTGNIPSTESIIAGKGADPNTIAKADPSAWSKAWDFAKNNQTLVGGALQAGAAFLSGATSTLTPAQVNALNAQAQANQAAVNLSGSQQAILDQQLGNMRDPVPIAARPNAAAVTGAPVGLINQPPPKAAVTGTPA